MYLPQLTHFYQAARSDLHLQATHISLYMAIFELWNQNSFENPVRVRRAELMPMAKISGRATYHKCLRELVAYGYIRYEPSFHPGIGSLVYLLPEVKP